MDIADVRKNTKILINNIPYNVEENDFVKPGKGRAIYRLKLRNLLDSSTVDRTYHSGEKVDEAHTTAIEEQFLYREEDDYVFMNTATFEQHSIPGAQLGDKKLFLKEGTVVTTLMLGDRILDITLPNFIELQVKESNITPKSATISPQLKSVTMETGCVIGVPAFIKEGDIIKVDTRSGTYVERVGTKK